jgi:hypothetical protein
MSDTDFGHDVDTDLDLERMLEDSNDIYLHIVSYGQWLWAEKICRRVPRALCGVLLAGDMDKPDAGPNAPKCSKCRVIAGPGSTTYIPGHGG